MVGPGASLECHAALNFTKTTVTLAPKHFATAQHDVIDFVTQTAVATGAAATGAAAAVAAATEVSSLSGNSRPPTICSSVTPRDLSRSFSDLSQGQICTASFFSACHSVADGNDTLEVFSF